MTSPVLHLDIQHECAANIHPSLSFFSPDDCSLWWVGNRVDYASAMCSIMLNYPTVYLLSERVRPAAYI